MSGSAFVLPKDGAIYSDNIFDRCRDLIAYQVWSGIDVARLDAWINNFQTPEERYFAACVLDALIYRSDDQTLALGRQLFQRVLPDAQRILSLPTSIADAYFSLTQVATDPGLRLVPVLRPDDPYTKSGLAIARMLKRRLAFAEEWIIRPEEVETAIAGGVQVFVFIDDFLGTGDQFTSFLTTTGLADCLNNMCALYAPLAAHSTGCSALQSAFPAVTVCPVELLTDRHAIFSEEYGAFRDGSNSAESARGFYYDLMSRNGFTLSGSERRGYGHFELVYAFEHAAPDNSLPILWWRLAPGWQWLFDR